MKIQIPFGKLIPTVPSIFLSLTLKCDSEIHQVLDALTKINLPHTFLHDTHKRIAIFIKEADSFDDAKSEELGEIISQYVKNIIIELD